MVNATSCTPTISVILAVALLFGVLGCAKETVEDAAIIARQLVESSTAIGTMATVYPNDHPSLAGQPFALQEYFASCHQNGSLSLIFMPISRHSQNILHSPEHSASIAVWSRPPAASRARVSLMGNVTILPAVFPGKDAVMQCYLDKHPDAKWWLPGDDNAPHTAHWARFDPVDIYFVGGFGDEHYIGSIPLKLYQGAMSLREDEAWQSNPSQSHMEKAL